MTFDVDVNGILQVTAEDKAAKKSKSITITSENGRLSEEEIKRKVMEAEEFAEEDRMIRERIEARNKLEAYVFSMKSTVRDNDKFAEKIDEDDKEKIESALKEAMEWLDSNVEAEKEELEERMEELEAVCNTIMKKAYEESATSTHHEEDGEEPYDEL